jgi:hypothetical protein
VCPNVDVDGDGAVDVAELIRAVRAALSGCAAALPEPPDQRGIYDGHVDLTGELQAPSEAVAQVHSYHDMNWLEIFLTPNFRIHVSGRPNGATLPLDGYLTYTDVGYGISGTATISNTDEEEVIEGSVQTDIASLPPETASFVLRRSHVANPQRFAGRYRFEVPYSPSANGPSTFEINLDIAPNGAALSGEGVDRDSNATPLGTLTTGDCVVAPQGHFYCRMVYLISASGLSTPLQFTGVLSTDASGTSGSGQFLSGYDPPFGPEPYVSADWSARRISESLD